MARGADSLTSSEVALRPRWAGTGRVAARRRITRLARALERAYGTPDLGNLTEPLDEAIFIVLTYQSDVARSRLVWTALKARFPTWTHLLGASERDLERVLKPNGLHRSRARLVRLLLGAVQARFGVLSLDELFQLSDQEAEKVLRELPGIGIKGARCVLLYALRRSAFPVDSNVFRFMKRYGILRMVAGYRQPVTHDALQQIIPKPLRHGLHVNLVVHGQRVCRPQRPRCRTCFLRRSCETGQSLERVAKRADERQPRDRSPQA